jgi:hypothetical protein
MTWDLRASGRSRKKHSKKGDAARPWTADSGEAPADYIKRILEAVRSEKGGVLPPVQVNIREVTPAPKVEDVLKLSSSDLDTTVEVEVLRPPSEALHVGWNKALHDHASHALEELMLLEQCLSPSALMREFSNRFEGKVPAFWARPRGMRFLSEPKND